MVLLHTQAAKGMDGGGGCQAFISFGVFNNGERTSSGSGSDGGIGTSKKSSMQKSSETILCFLSLCALSTSVCTQRSNKGKGGGSGGVREIR